MVSFNSFSQNFENVDAIVLKYPNFSKVEDLANQIEKDFTTDKDKSRAAFFWLAKNIRYNLKQFYSQTKRSYRFQYASEEEKEQKLQELKNKLVADTFKNKSGVCEEYAQSFKKICDLLNIESAVLTGHVRNNSREIGIVPSSTNHAWNAVKIDEKWLILDATWAAGYENNGNWIRDFNDYFFDMPKDKIFKSHFPSETIWVLRFGRMTLEEFYNQPIYSPSFLHLKATLISPSTGIIKRKSSENIEIQFKDLNPNSLIFYTINETRLAQKPVINLKDNITTVVIKNPKANTDLVLFMNRKDALHFKVVME